MVDRSGDWKLLSLGVFSSRSVGPHRLAHPLLFLLRFLSSGPPRVTPQRPTPSARLQYAVSWSRVDTQLGGCQRITVCPFLRADPSPSSFLYTTPTRFPLRSSRHLPFSIISYLFLWPPPTSGARQCLLRPGSFLIRLRQWVVGCKFVRSRRLTARSQFNVLQRHASEEQHH